MTFTYEKAVKIADHYQYLIGKSIDRFGDQIITNILITPFDEAQRADYFQEYNLFHDKEDSLVVSGYDSQKVYVEIASERGAVNRYIMLDQYLGDMGLIDDFLNLITIS
jgi:hypothetical protein